MPLTALLTELSVNITPENTKEIETIWAAFGRPEYLLESNNFIHTRIQKLNDSAVADLLFKLEKILKDTFKDDTSRYQANEIHYDQITSFWPSIDILKYNYLYEKIVPKIKHIADTLDKTNQQFHYTTLTEDTFENSFLKMNAYDAVLALFSPELLSLIKKIPEPNESQFLLQFHNLKFNTVQYKIFTLASFFNNYFNDRVRSLEAKIALMRSYYENCAQTLILASSRDTPQELLLPYALLVQHLINAYDSIEWFVINGLPNEVLQAYDANNQNNCLSEHYNRIVDNINKLNVKLTSSDYPFESDLSFGGKIFDNDLYMSFKLVMDFSTLNSEFKENYNYLIAYAQFDLAHKALLKQSKDRMIIPLASKKLDSAMASLHILIRACTGWKKDSDCTRQFNYIHYAKQVIRKLKEIPPAEVKKETTSETAFLLTLESTIRTLFNGGHDNFSSSFSYEFMFGDPLSKEKKDYYDLVTRQQLLLLTAELLCLQISYGKNAFSNEETEVSIKKHLTPEQYQKYYALYGSDGLFDIILNKVNELDVLIAIQGNNPCLLQPVPYLTHQSQIWADKNYSSLLAELDKEEKAIIATAETQLTQLKKKRIKSSKKPTKAKPHAFFEVKAPTERLIPLTEAHYLKAGCIRLQNNDVHESITIYESITQEYLKNPIPHNEALDYFYIAASLAELADCYIHKACLETPEHLLSQSSNIMPMIKHYNTAIKYAKSAEDCFLNHVIFTTEAEMKKYEDLADHIHTMLSQATQHLELVEAQYKEMITHLEHRKIFEAQNRLAAIQRMGGITQWRNNPKPNNYYLKKREEENKILSKFKSATKLVKSLINTKYTPVKKDFAYLIGETPILLLMPSHHETNNTSEKTVLKGGGLFYERLRKLAESTNNLVTDTSNRVRSSLT